MKFSEGIKNFFFSYGLIVLGVFFLFVGSVSFTSQNKNFIQFPRAGERPLLGGDVALENFPASQPVVPLSKVPGEYSGQFTASTVLAVDDGTGTVLFQKNGGAIRPLASLTKLMTAMALLDLPLNWQATTTIIKEDNEVDSHFINEGEIFSLDDLWHVALIGSSNGAISALVRNTGLTTEEFTRRMNRQASELGLKTARFVEPTGLDDGNVASAEDISKLLKEALRFDKIYKTLQVGEYYARPLNKNKPRRVWSTDWLLTKWIPSDFKPEDIAGKTGYISSSLYNFAVRLSDPQSHAIRVVVLGAASNEARFMEARDLAKWLFDHYVWPDEEGYNKLTE
ncbi:MAG: serine hydrolase [Patescibacteria group bacterium]